MDSKRLNMLSNSLPTIVNNIIEVEEMSIELLGASMSSEIVEKLISDTIIKEIIEAMN